MINSSQMPRAYSEVYSFINALGKIYIDKIPISLYTTIENERDKNYNPIYKNTQNISKEDISHEALSLISAINLEYWCTDDNEKEELKNAYKNNSKIEKEKYSYEHMFKNSSKLTVEDINIDENMQENFALTEKNNENIFIKIINKIKKFFI